jgi:hypothetical protein
MSIKNKISICLKEKLSKSLTYTSLTPSEIAYITKLVKDESNISSNSSLISQIDSEFADIITKKGTKLYCIPDFIFFLANLLKNNIIQNNVKNVNIINLTYFILYSLFDSNILELNHVESKITKKLIDSSLQLLLSNINFVIQEDLICGCYKRQNLENECYNCLECYGL